MKTTNLSRKFSTNPTSYLTVSLLACLCAISAGILTPKLWAQAGALDSSLDPAGGADFVNTLAVQEDGKIVIGGAFQSVNKTNRNRIARLNADGSLDLSFDPGAGADQEVSAVTVQSDGKILVAGLFGSFNANNRPGMARLNSDGSLDLTFNPSNPLGSANAFALQNDGKLLISGGAGELYRLNPNGSLDSTFASSLVALAGNPQVFALRLTIGDKIIAAGNLGTSGPGTNRGVVRLNSNGSLDSSFNTGGVCCNGVPGRVAIQQDGKILISGPFDFINGVARPGLARLNANGSLDMTFVPDMSGGQMAVQSDGKILLSSGTGVVRLNTDGTRDLTFAAADLGGYPASSLAVQSDGKILLSGIHTVNGVARNGVARLHGDGNPNPGSFQLSSFPKTVTEYSSSAVFTVARLDGRTGAVSVDYTFGGGTATGGLDYAATNGTLFFADGDFGPKTFSMAILDDNLIEGPETVVVTLSNPSGGAVLGNPASATVTILDNEIAGGLDLTFTSPFTAISTDNALAIQADGKIVAGGNFNWDTNLITRLATNGVLDSTFPFHPVGRFFVYPKDFVGSLALQTDAKVIIGGQFTQLRSASSYISRNGIARLNTDGFADLTFDPGTGVNGSISTVALQTDGKILAGGLFSSVNGTVRTNFARFTSTGSLDSSFNPDVNGRVTRAVVQSNGKMLIAGEFTLVNGLTSPSGLARLNIDGSLDSTFTPDMNGHVDAVGMWNNQIVISGSFTLVNGAARYGLARLNNDGSLDNAFLPAIGAQNSSVNHVLLVEGSGAILMANNDGILRFNVDGSIDSSYYPVRASGIQAMALQRDGKLVIGGFFGAVNGVQRYAVARLNGPPLIAPFILAHPQSQIVAQGEAVTYSVSVSNNATLPINYRWRRNLSTIVPTTNLYEYTSLFSTNAQTNGIYSVLLSNIAGQSSGGLLAGASSNGYLFVMIPPTNQTVDTGANASFSIGSRGGGPLAYQWQFNGSDIVNARSSSLSLNNVQGTNSGLYSVIVTAITNAYVPPVTFSATLTVRPPVAPSIVVQPQTQNVACHSNVVFRVEATGTLPLYAQWYFKGYALPGATNRFGGSVSTLSLGNVNSMQAGAYSVVVWNSAGTVTSDDAVLRIVDTNPPAVTCPANITAACGGANGTRVFFTASAIDDCDPTVQVNCVPPSGTFFSVGTNVIECSAVDSSGNRGSCTFNITVEDSAPVLSIARDGTNVVISWPQSCSDFLLQEARALNNESWAASQAATLIGSNLTVILPAGDSSTFFRLVRR